MAEHTEPAERTPGLARNSVLMAAGFTATSGFMLLTDFAVIEAYDPAAHGRVTLALAVAIMGALLCDLGLASKAGVRTIAALRGGSPPEDGVPGDTLGKAIGRLLLTLMVTGFAAALLVNLSAPLLSAWLELPDFALRQASVWLLAGCGVRACAMVFIGFERVVYVAVLGAIAEGARFGWTVLCGLLALEESYLYVGWSVTWVASMLVSAACVVVMLGRQRVRITWGGTPLRAVIREVRRGQAYLMPMLTNQALPPVLFLLVAATLRWRGMREIDASATLSALKLCFSLALVLRIVSQAMATSLFPVVARRSASGDGGGIDTGLLASLSATVRVLRHQRRAGHGGLRHVRWIWAEPAR